MSVLPTSHEARCPRCDTWFPLVILGGPSEVANAVKIGVGIEHRHNTAFTSDESLAIINSIRLK